MSDYESYLAACRAFNVAPMSERGFKGCVDAAARRRASMGGIKHDFMSFDEAAAFSPDTFLKLHAGGKVSTSEHVVNLSVKADLDEDSVKELLDNVERRLVESVRLRRGALHAAIANAYDARRRNAPKYETRAQPDDVRVPDFTVHSLGGGHVRASYGRPQGKSRMKSFFAFFRTLKNGQKD